MIQRGILAGGLAMLVALGGCSGASMLLKTPIADECATTGLKGCPEIAEGMLLYVEGDKAAALQKLARGAARNSPEQVEAFAKALLALKSVPGAEPYAALLDEATEVLVEHAGADEGRSRTDEDVRSAETTASCGARLPGQPTLTADTDPAQAIGGVVAPHRPDPAADATLCRVVAGSAATCRVVRPGTAYLTDLVSLGSDCVGQFVAVLRKDQVRRYALEGPFNLHGARLLLRPGDTLVFGQREGAMHRSPEAPQETSDVVLEEVDPRHLCDVLWSGFKPYQDRLLEDPWLSDAR